jgi:hypothetical protein
MRWERQVGHVQHTGGLRHTVIKLGKTLLGYGMRCMGQCAGGAWASAAVMCRHSGLHLVKLTLHAAP